MSRATCMANLKPSRGRASARRSSSGRNIASTTEDSSATTVANRGVASNSAISPKHYPGRISPIFFLFSIPLRVATNLPESTM